MTSQQPINCYLCPETPVTDLLILYIGEAAPPITEALPTESAFLPSRFVIAQFAAVIFLWWRLLDHLRLEWSINPQYAYGWAVPLLCLYLARRRLAERTAASPGGEHAFKQPLKFSAPSLDSSRLTGHRPRFRWVSFWILASLWPVTRLIEEANPEWRLVSWALACEVVGVTLVMLHFLLGGGQKFFLLIFPISFILVAVPWPSLIEEPLIQGLSRATAALNCEILNLAGTPAVQSGNLVEVGPGLVGIEEACSGIRSIQATLMLSIFFGGLYRLGPLRRIVLISAGFVLAFGFNVLRTTLLSMAAANQGMAAINAWHDAVGLLTPLAAFLGLALLARVADKTAPSKPKRSQESRESFKKPLPYSLSLPVLGPEDQAQPGPFWPGLALLGWLALAETGTEAWYRVHESRLPAPTTWQVVLPHDATLIDKKSLSGNSKQLLRFDTGVKTTWQDNAGRKWQSIFLYWKPRRVAARLAKDHTPAICLSAAGRTVLSSTQEDSVTIRGMRMRIYCYAATDNAMGKVHVLYTIREDRSLQLNNLMAGSIWQERLAPVLAGWRNSGQRSLELAVWGIEEDAEATKALIEQAQRIVRTSGNS